MFSRRRFIRVGAATVGSLALRPLGLLPALAQSGSSDYRALVCVFLFGGNDSNNMVIPMNQFQQYTSLRSILALNTSQLTTPTLAKSDNAPYAFHSSLTELASMFANKELAIAANVGPLVQPLSRAQYQAQATPVPQNLFSHSDQQIAWQTSISQGHSATGWAGRAADVVSSMNGSDFPTFLSVAGNSLMGNGVSTQPVALSPGQSLALQGFNSTAASNARYAALQTLLTTEQGVSLVQSANNTVNNSIADATALGNALSKATPLKTAFPNTGLGAQLKQVAQIIQIRDSLGMRRQIFFCSLGGFDTHTNEINTHLTLYPQLSKALAAFSSAMQELQTDSNVTTFTESDFSRTFQPTSGDGSDHAWGSNHLVMGGAVLGGDVYGSFPTFQLSGPDDADTRGRWIPKISVDQYGATLASWFGIPDSQLASVFPSLTNFSTQKLGFLG